MAFTAPNAPTKTIFGLGTRCRYPSLVMKLFTCLFIKKLCTYFRKCLKCQNREAVYSCFSTREISASFHHV